MAATSLVTALIVGGGTYALWSATDSFSGMTVTAGDLTLTAGVATWEQLTPGVTNPQSGQFTGNAVGFIAMPGDVIEVVQPVTTTLVGENLAAGFVVDFADAAGNADVEAGRIAVSFHVQNAASDQVAPDTGQAQLGSVIEVPGLRGSNEGETDLWNVVIHLDVLGEYVWVPSPPMDATGTVTAGTISVSLRQLRAGDDYRPIGGS